VDIVAPTHCLDACAVIAYLREEAGTVGCYEQALAALEHLPEQRQLHEQAIDLWPRPSNYTAP
jgi:hypothetical protein